MYRIIKVRAGIPLQRTSRTPPVISSPVTQLCSFCKYYHNPRGIDNSLNNLRDWQIRSQSTTANTAVLNVSKEKKTSKRKSKNYAELLEVTESTSSNRKAAIKRLSAAQLSQFVDHPDVSLDEMHKIKKPKKVDEISEDVWEDMEASGIVDNSVVIKNNYFFETLAEEGENDQTEQEEPKLSEAEKTRQMREETSKAQVKKTAKKTKNRHMKEQIAKMDLDKIASKAKEENLYWILISYIDVCNNCGMLAHAYKSFTRYRKMHKNGKGLSVNNINIYNAFLSCFASKGNLNKIKEILSSMNEDKVKCTAVSYASIFECVGKFLTNDGHEEFLEKIVKQMESDNITLKDVFEVPKFVEDQREHAFSAIKLLYPDFQYHTKYKSAVTKYDCNLLKDLTTNQTYLQNRAEGLTTTNELLDAMRKQVALELQGVTEINSIAKEKFDKSAFVSQNNSITKDIEAYWTDLVTRAFEKNLSLLECRELQSQNLISLFPYLTVMEKEVYVGAIMREIRSLVEGSDSYGHSMYFLRKRLGRYIFQRYALQQAKKHGVVEKTLQVYQKYCEWYMGGHESAGSEQKTEEGILTDRVKWQMLTHEAEMYGTSLTADTVLWPVNIIQGVGRFLYEIIMKDLKFNTNCLKISPDSSLHYLPVFYTLYRAKGKIIKEQIKAHPLISKLYQGGTHPTLTFDTTLLPTICPPRPWTSVKHGGYVIANTELIRSPNYTTTTLRRKLARTPNSQLYPVYDCLNHLSGIPWRINNEVLDILIKVFQKGGSVKLNVPQPPQALRPMPPLPPDATKAQRYASVKMRAEFVRKKAEMYSIWCDARYKLSLANHFRDRVFWLPHSIDFRGRVYPIPPHLTHLGSDMSRSFLLFAKGKPLGPEGLNWLKIHCINLTGLKKKRPIRERLEYANEIIDEILDSAEKPLTGNQWWAASDEPWQTLAACMEISKAMKCPNPSEFVSGFPVHQDGSCNGLQHYAALGRDEYGARSVNLYPFDTPQDIYSDIVDLVDKMRAEDEQEGVEVAVKLKGFISRKVIKQTVMTTVYGVTLFGARLQIARQLKDLEDFPDQHIWEASHYLVRKTFDSLRTMFKSARQIQDWFTESAFLIAKEHGETVEWVTPLGLPVVQPYCVPVRLNCVSEIGASIPVDLYEKPNTMKQKNAFPPNFIHSLDSCHMMLTCLFCQREDVTFVSVHDCFWTHPASIKAMSKICREQFVNLHSEPILESLSEFLVKRYTSKNSNNNATNEHKKDLIEVLRRVPEKGDFDIKSVLKSTYFFS